MAGLEDRLKLATDDELDTLLREGRGANLIEAATNEVNLRSNPAPTELSEESKARLNSMRTPVISESARDQLNTAVEIENTLLGRTDETEADLIDGDLSLADKTLNVLQPVGEALTDAFNQASDKFSEVAFGEPLGLSEDTKTEFEKIGLFRPVEPGVVGAISKIPTTAVELVAGGLAATIDVGFRTILAPIMGGITFTADLYESALEGAGVQNSKTKRGQFERDILGMVESTFLVAGLATPRAFRAPRRRGKDVPRTEEVKTPGTVNTEGLAERIFSDAETKAIIDRNIAGLTGQAEATARAALEEGMNVVKKELGEPVNINPKDFELGILQNEFGVKIASTNTFKATMDAASELLVEAGVKRDTSRSITDQISELLVTSRVTDEQIALSLNRSGITFEDFSAIIGQTATEAGRTLNAASQAARRLELARRRVKGEESKELTQEFTDLQDALGVGTRHSGGRTGQVWRSLNNVRRGMMVTQIATSMRNINVQALRVGLNTLQTAMDTSMRAVFNRPGLTAADSMAGFDQIVNIFRIMGEAPALAGRRLRAPGSNRPPKGIVERNLEILEMYPAEHDALFLRFMGDIEFPVLRKAPGGKLVENTINGLSTVTQMANVFNRMQEFGFRHAIFASRLDRSLRAKGTSIAEATRNNDFRLIDREMIQDAVGQALELTFAAPVKSQLGRSLVSLINNSPLTLVAPYPRFVTNAAKFMMEFSNPKIFNLLTKKGRDAFANGDMTAISTTIISGASFYAAWQAVRDPSSGDKWYEFIDQDTGEVLDIRTSTPLTGPGVTGQGLPPTVSAHLYLNHLYRRAEDGTLQVSDMRQIVQEAQDLVAGVRVDTNEFNSNVVRSLEAIIDTNATDPQVLFDELKSLTGNVVSQVFTPFKNLVDLGIAFDESEQARDQLSTAGQPFLGPIKRSLPETLSNQLPGDQLGPAQSPTRSATPRTPDPVLKQLLGLTYRDPKNSVETQIDRLGVSPSSFRFSSSIKVLQDMVHEEMGPIVETIIVPLVDSPVYQSSTPAVQRIILTKALAGARKQAVERVRADPEKLALISRQDIERLPRGERLLLDEAGILEQLRELLPR